ncbi:MAG: TonB-dependent receptor, partial [Gemmatimonadales bacterium]
SGSRGLRIPPAALQEATLTTNAFSAQYGQALSGVISAYTRDGGERLEGSLAYETDRPLPGGSDIGLDRMTATLGGPLAGPVRFFAAVDAQARVDDDPVNAPPSTDPRDPRTAQPALLPHNSGERYDLLGKLTVSLGGRHELRVLGVASEEQRLLFDPVLKYAPATGAGQRISGRFALLHLRRGTASSPGVSLGMDLRLGAFQKEAIRAPLTDAVSGSFGAFTFRSLPLAGEELANARDSAGAVAAIPEVSAPTLSAQTPWGVPAFFYTASPRSEVVWNRFREVRARMDFLLALGFDTDVRFGGEYLRQEVATFTRLEAYRSVGQGAPAPRVSAFSPHQASGYVELQQRAEDLTITAGLRADAFDARVVEGGFRSKRQFTLTPRVAVSTPLGPATVVVSIGRFAQPPDFQYLVDAAFEDTLRTGRFRRGNPSLGFESSTQYEFQVRARPWPSTGLRAGVFVKRLDGLITSIPLGFDPDSSIFGNGDFGDVRGLELSLQRDFADHVGVRLTYVLQQAEATATDARDLFRRLQISPVGDTIVPATAQFPLDFDRRHAVIAVGRVRTPESWGAVLHDLEGAAVARWSSGLPFTRTNLAGDSILGLPNSSRLPETFTLDVFARRTLVLGGLRFGFYVDVRNVTDRRNVVAVRRDSGTPTASAAIRAAIADAAYQAHPEPIPYESSRYRPWADTDGDGLISGPDELVPLYERAADDFTQPLFFYGPPRLARLGVEIAF